MGQLSFEGKIKLAQHCIDTLRLNKIHNNHLKSSRKAGEFLYALLSSNSPEELFPNNPNYRVAIEHAAEILAGFQCYDLAWKVREAAFPQVVSTEVILACEARTTILKSLEKRFSAIDIGEVNEAARILISNLEKGVQLQELCTAGQTPRDLAIAVTSALGRISSNWRDRFVDTVNLYPDTLRYETSLQCACPQAAALNAKAANSKAQVLA